MAKKAGSKKADGSGPGKKIVASNRKARHTYSILETFEAGVALVGALFALSFDTVSQAALFAVAGVQAVEGITRTLTCPIASVAGE